MYEVKEGSKMDQPVRLWLRFEQWMAPFEQELN